MKLSVLCRFTAFSIVLLGAAVTAAAQVLTGADLLVAERLDLLTGKRVALITNHTGRLSTGEPLADELLRRGIRLVRLFGPEHGIRGLAAAGAGVSDSVDVRTGVPVTSLYGRINKPTPELLKNVDLILYDIQDVGTRFYTYISTMALCMEAAAGSSIPFIVLDRPNPQGGELVDGPVLDDSLRSFVGIAPLPVVYGLTCGELAMVLNGERLLGGGIQVDLTVIPMKGWSRNMIWNDCGFLWVPPSPNLRTAEAALVYPATCLIEATNVSEGRGTENPFLTIGAPFIDGKVLADELGKLGLRGLQFSSTTFVPSGSKFKGQQCRGVSISVTDPGLLQPTKVGLSLLVILRNLYPGDFQMRKTSFERLFGVRGLYDRIMNGDLTTGDIPDFTSESTAFRETSIKYRLYPAGKAK